MSRDGPQPDHAVTAAVVAQRLGSDVQRGLYAHEVAARLVEHGPNELDQGQGVNPWRIPARSADNADDPAADCRGGAPEGERPLGVYDGHRAGGAMQDAMAHRAHDNAAESAPTAATNHQQPRG